MNLKLSIKELNILATRNGNVRECRVIRSRLAEAGLKYCPDCGVVKFLDDFGAMGKHKQARCRSCNRSSRRLRPFGQISIGDSAERTRRYRAAHPERDKKRQRDAYAARKASGLTPYEASYQFHR